MGQFLKNGQQLKCKKNRTQYLSEIKTSEDMPGHYIACHEGKTKNHENN